MQLQHLLFIYSIIIVFTILTIYQFYIDKHNNNLLLTYFMIIFSSVLKYYLQWYTIVELFPIVFFVFIIIITYDTKFTKSINSLDKISNK